jgi:hypothetical protein
VTAHVREQLSAYLDRELAGGDRQAVDLHLRECSECAQALDQMRAVDALVRAADLEAPAGYFEGLPARLRGRLRPARRASVPAWTVALAAGIAVAVAAPLVMRGRPTLSTGAAPAAGPQAPTASAPMPVPPPASEGVPSSQSRVPYAAAPAPTPAPRASAEAKAEPPAAARLARRDRAGEQEARPAAPPAPAAATGVVGGAPRPAPDSVSAEAVAPAEEDESPRESLVDDSGDPEPRRERAALGAAQRAAPRRAPGANVPDQRFRSLSTRTARGADEARALRDAWLEFVRDDPDGAHADQARLRALEAGAAAWRLGGRAEDRALVEREGRAYLRRADGAHHERVRALLASLEP